MIWATGVSSALSTYIVGVYSNKEFLGKSNKSISFSNSDTMNVLFVLGAGATISVAEEMAARDALRRWFETDEQRAPIPFDKLYKNGSLMDK